MDKGKIIMVIGKIIGILFRRELFFYRWLLVERFLVLLFIIFRLEIYVCFFWVFKLMII